MTELKTSIIDLKVNGLLNPIGVETSNPILSWIINSKKRSIHQTAYRIIVSSSLKFLSANNGDLWDSKKVETDSSVNISYEGMHMNSAQRCWWKVCVWTDGCEIWSDIAFWEMGLLKEDDWNGKWIAASSKGAHAPYLRKTFFEEREVKKARAYICGIGYYEFYINGKKIGNKLLNPAFTKYDKTVLYDSYDITEIIKKGDNAIGIVLGNGWYNSLTECVWDFNKASWRHIPKVLLQINIEFNNGDILEVISDQTWSADDSPIIFNAVRNGEFYDARLEQEGWNDIGFDDSNWRSVGLVPGPGGRLISQQMPAIELTNIFKPISVTKIENSILVFDFGKNISGWAELRINGTCGDEIILKYGERLNERGTVDNSSIDQYISSGEFQTDRYILKGAVQECWHPIFTYHGFRFVEVTGIKDDNIEDALIACFIHTAFEKRGDFICSNELFNKIQDATVLSSLGNYHGYPTDCPQREKNGWTCDAHLSAQQLLLNFNPSTAYRKWMADFRDVQRESGQLPGIVPTASWGYNWGSGPAWDSAFILIPWYVYEYTGDISLLKDNYKNMKKYVSYMQSMSNDNVVCFGLGDWLPPGGNKNIKCPTEVTDTAYFYVDTLILSKIASVLGFYDESGVYLKLANQIKKSFRSKFIDFDCKSVTGDCQTSIACAIYQGLIEDDEKVDFTRSLVKKVEETNSKIDCGILGTKYILHALVKGNRADKAYELANQNTYPSFGHWIMQGATTLWEDWEGVGSLNHHMFGDISAWFYKVLAGINTDINNPGFKNIIIKPNFIDDLDWVKAYHISPYGKIEVFWKRSGNNIQLNIVIPPNSTANLYIDEQIIGIKEKNISVDNIEEMVVERSESGAWKLNIKSGDYFFELYKNNE